MPVWEGDRETGTFSWLSPALTTDHCFLQILELWGTSGLGDGFTQTTPFYREKTESSQGGTCPKSPTARTSPGSPNLQPFPEEKQQRSEEGRGPSSSQGSKLPKGPGVYSPAFHQQTSNAD